MTDTAIQPMVARAFCPTCCHWYLRPADGCEIEGIPDHNDVCPVKVVHRLVDKVFRTLPDQFKVDPPFPGDASPDVDPDDDYRPVVSRGTWWHLQHVLGNVKSLASRAGAERGKAIQRERLAASFRSRGEEVPAWVWS